MIVLDGAEAINFEFLGLNPRDRPVDRLDNQAAQDALCQRLLLLGAKWWDSEARCLAVAQLVVYGERVEGVSSVDAEPQPTRHEKNSRSGAHQRGGCGSPSPTRPLRRERGGQSAASLETNNFYNNTPSDYSIKGKKMKVPELEKH